jgi:hypothetical protein
MPASPIAHIPDPLVDAFTLNDLPRIAPWVAEELDQLGRNEVGRVLSRWGKDIDEPQPMTTWVSVLKRCHSDLWAVAG